MAARIATPSKTQSLCLVALSADALARLKPHLKEVFFEAGVVLWEVGQPQRHVYFPISGLISVTLPMQDGTAIEVAVVGREGAAGDFDGVQKEAATRATVLIGGAFAQIATGKLVEQARDSRELERMLNLCRGWLLMQAQQLAACNATHAADKRLCRWLASCRQRVDDGRIHATQEMIAALIGLRRPTVTLMAQALHEQGLIEYVRGKITVRDAQGLEDAACECCANLGRAYWPATRLAAPATKVEG